MFLSDHILQILFPSVSLLVLLLLLLSFCGDWCRCVYGVAEKEEDR